MKSRRDHIFDELTDLVAEFLYYDRKEDVVLPRGAIEEAIRQAELTIDELSEHFGCALRKGLR